MDTVIVLEPDTPTNVRILGPDRRPADPENPVRRAHAAPAEASGLCGPHTLCGLDTSDMTMAPRHSTETTADRPRHRPHWSTCGTCRTAEERTGPRTPHPATPHTPPDDHTPTGEAPAP
ncbi:hypothetical protein GCM10018790_13140 [Kitasatospora xanthocidica]|uniref:hypothetical protein n=1 Tax=Kitasatospora xanthocidica TaxID=83382 RepID=UPI001673B952|nr:hypothetical protein [Kitasatospora xanthocidica]GHF36875.1 hypothetical protein GCM10018790_13140 [Kitasatospora xanthocidica]